MKKLFACFLALASAAAFGTTTVPVQLLNSAGSSSGQTIVSTGTSSDPGWANVSATTLTGILPVTNGGTNCGTATGACLDNITGFSSTGFMSRTGAGSYAFTASTGTGSVVLATSPALTTPNLGTPTAVTLTNGTGLPISTGISGLGTGVAAGLSNAVTGSGSPVLQTSPIITTPFISGATSGACPGAGYIGQCLSSNVGSGSSVSLTSVTPANVTSISLTAGNWRVGGNVCYTPGASTSSAFNEATVNTVSASLPTNPGQGATNILTAAIVASNGDFCMPVGETFYTVSSTTTVYLIAFSGFSTSTMRAYGYLYAIRFN